MVESTLSAAIRALPKIELHRHLEGSVRLETLVSIARDYDYDMPGYHIDSLRPFVQIMPGETRSSQHFLAKFLTIRQFFRSEAVIRRVAAEIVADAAADQVRYMELRFTPRALSNVMGCGYAEAIGWVCEAVAGAGQQYGIEVRLIVSINRHEGTRIGQEVLDAALQFRNRGVVALDLAGNEHQYAGFPFRPLFEHARAEGLGITVHAGEWSGPPSVREALDDLLAERIGHGVRSIEDPALVDLLAERAIVLEVCPTSNYHSGVVHHVAGSALPSLYRAGVRTTLNTDDPLISDITLSDELTLAISQMGLTLDDVKRHVLNAAQGAFLPPDERAALVSRFQGWLAQVQ